VTSLVNPYIAGAPLRDEHGFFGRQGILDWVVRELHNPGTNSLVLSGQRRIGKTSLLLQLERTLPADSYVPVYFDLQHYATRLVRQVLADLAYEISQKVDGLSVPDVSDDDGRNFRHVFLPQLHEKMGGSRRAVLLLDEFDALDQTAKAAIDKRGEKVAAKHLFPFLHRVMTTDSRLAFIFIVGRRAEDLSLDFAATFKTSLSREIWVLNPESAEALVRQAEENNTLRFTEQAVARILSLTSGHPYLTQLLCQRIWERAYASTDDLSTTPQVDVSEVESAVTDALNVGKQAITWLWNGLSPAEKIYAAALAEAADEERESIPTDQVVEILESHSAWLHPHDLNLAPRFLLKRQVLELTGGREYRFAIELFRRWVHQYKPFQDVKSEVDGADPLAEQQFSLGQHVLRLGKPTAAIRYFRDALDTNPHHSRARFHLGETLLELGQIDEAVVELNKAYELDRDETSVVLARALAIQAGTRLGARDEEGALAICERALMICPDEETAKELRTKVWIGRGNAALERGELQEALTDYQQAGAESWEKAVVFVRRALENSPDLCRTRLCLSRILLELGHADEAMTELDVALAGYQETSVSIEEQDIDAFRHVLRESPQQLHAHLCLGQVLLAASRAEEAIAEFEEAYEVDKAQARLPLVRALVVQAWIAGDAKNWFAMLDSCTRAIQIDRANPEVLKAMATAITELQQEHSGETQGTQERGRSEVSVAGMCVNRKQLHAILSSARNYVYLLGVVALDADWPSLAKEWAARAADNPEFEVMALCESDNMLFSKSFTYDTDVAKERRSFETLKFIRDRAIRDFPESLMAAGVQNSLIGKDGKFKIEVMHLPVPVSIIQVDDRIFASLWLHEAEDFYEEITQRNLWHSHIERYISTYFDPDSGRRYACDLDDEVLELFDHNRIPRGIYPRSSFYDTDYSQLVVWAFVFDRRGRLLIHRRADNAKDNQGMWDKSVGGHTDLTDVDTSRAVPREVIEELFSEEARQSRVDFTVWAVSDRDIIYLGEWRPDQRRHNPFREIDTFNNEWAFFRLRDYERLYSPRTLPDGTVRRLRVIPDVFLFIAGPQLTEESLGTLKNSTFKLVELGELKDAMDKALRGEEVPMFDSDHPVPTFTPDLINIMTGQMRDTLEEFSQYIKRYVKS
jgi:tetratricopeptide (TPR) repeat protein